MQFGMVGSIFAKKVLKLEQPRVGLLNNGTEDTKGTPVQREAYALLKRAGDAGIIQFVGNVEAREAPLGAVDVLVCDGFTGNVYLKAVEGTAKLMAGYMGDIFRRNLLTKVFSLFYRSGIRDLKARMDYRESGGTIILGLSKPVFKAHGSSDARAIFSTVRQAVEYVGLDICGDVRAHIGQMKLPED